MAKKQDQICRSKPCVSFVQSKIRLRSVQRTVTTGGTELTRRRTGFPRISSRRQLSSPFETRSRGKMEIFRKRNDRHAVISRGDLHTNAFNLAFDSFLIQLRNTRRTAFER